MQPRRTSPFLALGASLLLLAPTASADFQNPQTPTFRGQPCTEFGSWETFTSAYDGPNSPDVAGSNSGATITQLMPGAILTSTGNIYHPSQIPAFRLDDTIDADALEVVLQTATLGNPRNQGSFILSFLDASQQTVVLAPTEIQLLVHTAPTREELLVRWDLTSQVDTILAYRIDWVSSASNSALTSVLLDVRTDCPTGTAECFGDGSGTACPCGNFGASGNGCASSVNSSGGRLDALGVASIGADTVVLQGSGMPNSSALYFQGTAGASAPFGDGLRCASGTIVRLGTNTNVGGVSQYPHGMQTSVSVRGGVASGDVRVYQVWYRNAASFCTASTFNLTNAVRITWNP